MEYNGIAKELLQLQSEIHKSQRENDLITAHIAEQKNKFIDMLNWVSMVLDTQQSESTPKIKEGIDNLIALKTEESELQKQLVVEAEMY